MSNRKRAILICDGLGIDDIGVIDEEEQLDAVDWVEAHLDSIQHAAIKKASEIATKHAMENGSTEDFTMGGHAIAAKILELLKG